MHLCVCMAVMDVWRCESLGILTLGSVSRYIRVRGLCVHLCAFNLRLLSELDKDYRCVCAYVCAGSDEKPLECEPDVAEHRTPTPPSPIP